MTDFPLALSDELQQLLERATALEQAEVKAGTVPDTLTPDAIEDLAAQAALEAVGPLQAEVEALRDALLIKELSEVDADDDDEPAGMDFDEPDEPKAYDASEVKAWEACPDCGSTGRDEFKDGTARCEDCGTVLSEEKALDLDDDDELAALVAGSELVVVEEKADTVALSEIELLQARREALEQ